MDYEAMDRAMSAAVLRAVTLPNGQRPHGRFWISDAPEEGMTDIPDRAKRFNRLADAWDAADRLMREPGMRGIKLEAVSVADLWASSDYQP